MKDRIKVQNFYKTLLTSNIEADNPNNTLEKSFNVAQELSGVPTYIAIDVTDEANRDIIYVHRKEGGICYYYPYNRSNPSATHSSGAYVYMNDVAEFFSDIFKNLEDFGQIKHKTGLYITVNGGNIKVNGQDIEVSDTDITLEDNTTNYVVFDYTDNTIKNLANTSGFKGIVLAVITTSGGNISTLTDKRPVNLVIIPNSNQFEFNNGELTIKNGVVAPANHTHTASDITDFDTAVTNNSDVSANTSARHTHANKSVLDNITDTGSGDKFLADDGTYKVIDKGDMYKSVYDSNNNGIVDDSERLGGKLPSEYAEANHTHALDDLSDVDTSSVSDGQVLGYDATNSVWKPINQVGISGKADKVSGATAGDFASLTSDGNLADSGYKPSDFALDNNVVHKSGEETISGIKHLEDSINDGAYGVTIKNTGTGNADAVLDISANDSGNAGMNLFHGSVKKGVVTTDGDDTVISSIETGSYLRLGSGGTTRVKIGTVPQDDTQSKILVLDNNKELKRRDVSSIGGGGGGGGGSGLSIAPVAKYDGSLVEGVFEEIQLPSDTTIDNIKAVLEGAPSGSDDVHDDTELKIEYTTDGGSTWTAIATINFDADDAKTNGVLIKDVVVGSNYTENTRIRFNITKVADNYAGDNLKVYFK